MPALQAVAVRNQRKKQLQSHSGVPSPQGKNSTSAVVRAATDGLKIAVATKDLRMGQAGTRQKSGANGAVKTLIRNIPINFQSEKKK